MRGASVGATNSVALLDATQVGNEECRRNDRPSVRVAPHSSGVTANARNFSHSTHNVLKKLTVSQPVLPLPRTLWLQKVHHRGHNSPPLVLIPRHTNTRKHFHPIPLSTILILFSAPHPFPAMGLRPSGFVINSGYAKLFHSMHTTWPTHHILIDTATRLTCGKQYNPQCLPLCTLLQFPANFSLSNQHLQHHTFPIPSGCRSRDVTHQVSHQN